MNLLSLIGVGRKSDASPHALRDALAQIDTAQLEARADELERRRREVLIDGDDADVAQLDAEMATVCRDIERAHALRARLQERLREAESAEQREAREHMRRAAEQETADAVAHVRKAYPKAAEAIVGCLARLAAAELKVRDFNAHLGPDEPALPSPDFILRGSPGADREFVERRIEQRGWFYDSANSDTPVEDDFLRLIKPAEDGLSGEFFHPYRRRTEMVRRRQVVVDVWRDGQPNHVPEPLSADVRLPNITPFGVDYHMPTHDPQAVRAAAQARAWDRPAIDRRSERFTREHRMVIDEPPPPARAAVADRGEI